MLKPHAKQVISLISTKAWYAYDPSKQRCDCYWKVDIGIDAIGSREV